MKSKNPNAPNTPNAPNAPNAPNFRQKKNSKKIAFFKFFVTPICLLLLNTTLPTEIFLYPQPRPMVPTTRPGAEAVITQPDQNQLLMTNGSKHR